MLSPYFDGMHLPESEVIVETGCEVENVLGLAGDAVRFQRNGRGVDDADVSKPDLQRGASIHGGTRRGRREDLDHPTTVLLFEGLPEHRDEDAAETGRRERREGQKVCDSVVTQWCVF